MARIPTLRFDDGVKMYLMVIMPYAIESDRISAPVTDPRCHGEIQ
jgi:hypothetical protein